MVVKFHEERLARSDFPKDDQGQSQGMYKPLRSKWLPRATGMWVRVWGASPDPSPVESAFEVSVIGMSAFEGPESGLTWGQTDGNEDLGSVLEGLAVGAGGTIGSTPVEVLAPAYNNSFAGRFTYTGGLVYQFENLGVAHPNLALKFYPHTFEETPDPEEPPVSYLGNPLWAAARIWYRVEH